MKPFNDCILPQNRCFRKCKFIAAHFTTHLPESYNSETIKFRMACFKKSFTHETSTSTELSIKALKENNMVADLKWPTGVPTFCVKTSQFNYGIPISDLIGVGFDFTISEPY